MTATANSLKWDSSKQGAIITALMSDNQGNVFVATEDNGVWMADAIGRWQQYTEKNSGIADNNVYALAIDKQNRVWAGTLNHGVSVFNGKTWQNFGLLDGIGL